MIISGVVKVGPTDPKIRTCAQLTPTAFGPLATLPVVLPFTAAPAPVFAKTGLVKSGRRLAGNETGVLNVRCAHHVAECKRLRDRRGIAAVTPLLAVVGQRELRHRITRIIREPPP